MNKLRTLTAFLLLNCFLVGTIPSQSLSTALKKIRTAYVTNKHLSFDVQVYAYTTKADKTPDLISKGYMKKNADKYYSNFNNYELMVIGEKALIVDHDRKSLDYYEYKPSRSVVPKNFQVNIDSLILATDSIVIRPDHNGLKHFTCFSKEGYVHRTEIYVDPQTDFIKRILYYYVESTEDFEIGVDRVEILYANIQVKPVEETFFSFDKYFKKSQTKIIPVGKYLAYRLNYHNTKS